MISNVCSSRALKQCQSTLSLSCVVAVVLTLRLRLPSQTGGSPRRPVWLRRPRRRVGPWSVVELFTELLGEVRVNSSLSRTVRGSCWYRMTLSVSAVCPGVVPSRPGINQTLVWRSFDQTRPDENRSQITYHTSLITYVRCIIQTNCECACPLNPVVACLMFFVGTHTNCESTGSG